MNNRIFCIISLAMVIAVPAFGQTAEEIIQRADATFELNRVYSKSTLTITRNGREQAPQVMETYEMDAPDGTTRSLSVFSAPPRVAGTAYLMIGNDLWVRFASTGRIRKMSSSAKQNSAAGSDFSYADMGEGSQSFTTDYIPKLDGSERLDGTEAWRIVLEPRSPDDQYDQLVVWIEKESYHYLRVEFHQDAAPIKVMDLKDYRSVGNTEYPFKIIMTNLTQDSVSIIVTDELEPDSAKVQERFFSQAYLRTIR